MNHDCAVIVSYLTERPSSMRKSDFRAKIVCSNYALKKAYSHWDNFKASNPSDLDEIDTAITYCSIAIKNYPQNEFAYSLRGSMYIGKEWYKWACRDLKKALSLGLKDEFVYSDLGFAYMLLQECNEAVNSFSNALEINPNYCFAWQKRGYTFTKMELYEKAIPDLKIALSLLPNDIYANRDLNRAYLRRGHLHLKAGKNLEAISDFTSATNSKDSVVEAYEGRAAAFMNLGRVDESTADIAKAKYIREEHEHAKKNSHD